MSHEPVHSNPSASALTVYTLGRFVVFRGQTPIEDSAWRRQKAKKLFKLLLLAPQRQLLKEQVLEHLWPDKTPEAGSNNLHRTLFVLRRVLEPDLENGSDSHYLAFKDDVLSLNPEAIAWVDAEEFERLIELARQQRHNLECYRAALQLYKGEFLPEDLYEDWAESRRNVLRQCHLDVLRRVAAIHAERGAYHEAINCLDAILSVDHTDEGVHRELMRLYAQTGERHKALRQYQYCCQILRAELGVEPSAQTSSLYVAIQKGSIPSTVERLPLSVSGADLPPLPEETNRVPLVGRRTEMQRLIEYLEQAERGQGTVVFLVGEQGVGKTRMGEELVTYARSTGAQALYGAAFVGEGRLLYAPFVEAIRRGLTPATLDLIRRRLGPLVNDLARLLPELVGSSPTENRPPETGINRLDIDRGDQERRRLFDAISATCSLFAQERPLVLFLDNLHAVGESSLQLLHYLARQIVDQQILVVCTVDQDKLRRGAPISLVFGELQRNQLAHRLNLTRLDPDEVGQFCAHMLDGGRVDSSLSRYVYELTDGNPFFVRELMLSLIKRGKVEQRDGSWTILSEAPFIVPASVKDVIDVHLGHLNNDTYHLLGVAAVIGHVFSYELLQATTQWHRGRLLDSFDEILREALVEESEHGYRFQHAMIRQAVYSGLSAERRAWLHEQVAQALELLAESQLDEQATVLAHHYEQAGEYGTAIRYLIRAGDWARGAYALRESLEHYNRALELHRAHPGAADVETVINLLERRSQTYLALSDFDSAIGDLERLLKTYQETGMEARVGETLYQMGFAHYWAHRLMKAAMYLDQALYTAETLDYSDLRNRALRLRDLLNSTQGSVVDSATEEIANEAEKIPSWHAEAYWGYAMLAHLRYDFESALRHAQTCIKVGHSLSNTFLTLGGYFILGMSQASLGDYQTALDSLQDALKLSETTGDRFWRARLLNTVGWVYRDLFSLGLAVQYDQASLELARASTPRLTEAEGNALANLATTYLLLGQHDQARAALDEGLALSVTEPFMRWRYFTRLLIAQGRLALADGDVEEAFDASERALDMARNTKARKNIARSCSLRGKIFLAMGEIDKARRAFAHALSVAQDLKNVGMIWTCHLALAEVEEAAGRPEVALPHYEAASDVVRCIASRLSNVYLREQFLNADPVRKVLAHA